MPPQDSNVQPLLGQRCLWLQVTEQPSRSGVNDKQGCPPHDTSRSGHFEAGSGWQGGPQGLSFLPVSCSPQQVMGILRGGPDRHPWGQVVHALFLTVHGQKVEVPGVFEKVGRDLSRYNLGWSGLSCPRLWT